MRLQNRGEVLGWSEAIAKNSAGRGSGRAPLPESIRSGTQNGKADRPALGTKIGQLIGKEGSLQMELRCGGRSVLFRAAR